MAFTADEARRLASDPATDAATLYRLAQENPDVLALLAGNPATYPDLLSWLGRLGIPEVDAALARRSGPPAPAVPSVPTAEAGPVVESPEAEPEETALAGPVVESPEAELEETALAGPVVESPEAELEQTALAGPVDDATAVYGAPVAGSPEPEEPAEEPSAPEAPVERIPGVGALAGTEFRPEPSTQPVAPPGGVQRESIVQRPTGSSPWDPVRGPNASYGGMAPQQGQQPQYAQYGAATGSGQPGYGQGGAGSQPASSYPGYGYPPQGPYQEEPKRKVPPAAWIAGIVGAVVLIGVVVWALAGGGGEPEIPVANPAPTVEAPTTPEPATTEPQITEPPTSEAPESELEAEFAALQDEVIQSAGASECTDAAADSEGLIRLAGIARELGGDASERADATTLQALLTLQQRCNAGWAVQVADSAEASAPEIGTLASRDWVIPVVSAPGSAREDREFTSPSGNIACNLTDDGGRCTIYEYDFTPAGSCTAGEPVTVVVDSEGARADCATEAVRTGPALEYDVSSSAGRFFCTSRMDGMHCTDSFTGAAFHVARATQDFADQVIGFQNAG
nr:hypothetical protein [Actinomycetales bacterium]